MIKKLIPGSIAAGLALLSQSVLAQAFNTFDPVSMAMGGTAVALPNPTTANLYNPAQIASYAEARDEDFAIGFSLGARAYDEGDVIDTVSDAMDDFDKLSSLAEAAEAATPDPDNLQAYADAARRLDRNLDKVSGKHAQVELGAALLTNLPMKGWGVGLSVSGEATIGAVVNYKDSARLKAWADAAESADPANPINPGDFYDESKLESEAEILGAAIGEVGVSFAKRIAALGPGVAIGITPKYVQVDTIYYKTRIDQADTDDIDASAYRQTYGDFNLDLGLTKDFDNGLYAGFVVKNLIARDYETVAIDNQSHTIALRPQARAGLGYDGGWYRFGVDADLTKNKPMAFEDGSQYVAVGAELSAFGWAQLRAGYRLDTVNSDRSVASIGFGLSPFKVLHFDVAVAGNDDEIGAAAQLALTF